MGDVSLGREIRQLIDETERLSAENNRLRDALRAIEHTARKTLYGDAKHHCGYRSLCQSVADKALAALAPPETTP